MWQMWFVPVVHANLLITCGFYITDFYFYFTIFTHFYLSIFKTIGHIEYVSQNIIIRWFFIFTFFCLVLYHVKEALQSFFRNVDEPFIRCLENYQFSIVNNC